MIILWLKFIFCAIVIIYSGIQAAKYGDMIAEKTGLSGSWIGVLLLASMTSLPELITGASSVLLVSVPNLAVGTIVGSAVFNLTIIALMDLFSKNGPVLRITKQNHILTAGFGIILLVVAGIPLLLHQQAISLKIGWFSIASPLLLMIYFVGMHSIFKTETQNTTIMHELSLKYENIPKAVVYRNFSLHAIVIICVSIWLPFIGDEIALLTGWGNTFFGTIFIAFATSMPEIVICLSALRIGATDMALAGILGSNLFNLAILAIDDLLYRQGSLFADVSPTHLLPIFSSILMSTVVLCTLIYKPRLRSLLRLNWLNILFFSLFLATAYGVFILERS